MLGYLRVSLYATFLLCMSGCGRSWNPDEQFQNQVDQISFQREMSARQNLVEAHKNISQFEMTLREKLVPGTSENELVDLLGNSYDLLARTLGEELLWERRSYDFNTLIKNRYGASSLEYSLVRGKPSEQIVITSNSRFLVTVETF